ncbi:MAG: TATA element modulatory factor 1, partial [Marteilia pararefringens]
MLDFNQLFQYSRRVLEDIRLRFHSLLSGDLNLPDDHNLNKNENGAEHSPKRVNELLQFFELYLLDPNHHSDRTECLIRNEFAIQKHSNELSELKKEFGECEKIIAELSGKYIDLVNKEQQIISKLEFDIRDTEREKITMKNEISQKISNAIENNRKSIGDKGRILSERLDENDKELWKQMRDNYEKENLLSQKNQKLRSEIKIWIDRYDNEMSKNQKIIDAIEKNFEEISAEKKIVDRDNDYYES